MFFWKTVWQIKGRVLNCNQSNRWSGDNGNYDSTESPRCWESGETQMIKWTAEGAVWKAVNQGGIADMGSRKPDRQIWKQVKWSELFVLDRTEQSRSVRDVCAYGNNAKLFWQKNQRSFFRCQATTKNGRWQALGDSGQESCGSEYGAVETERSQSSHTGGDMHENITRIKWRDENSRPGYL